MQALGTDEIRHRLFRLGTDRLDGEVVSPLDEVGFRILDQIR